MDEYTPRCKQYAYGGNEHGRVGKVRKIFVDTLESCNQSFNGQGDNHDHKETGQEPANPCWSAYISVSNDLFFDYCFRDLQCNDCRCQ